MNDFQVHKGCYTLSESFSLHACGVESSIGHLYLHFLSCKSQEPQTVYRLGRSAQQSEAHHFVAALIMPRQAFTHHWNHTTGGTLLKQSELFGTNIFYAHRRAIQLGLIT